MNPESWEYLLDPGRIYEHISYLNNVLVSPVEKKVIKKYLKNIDSYEEMKNLKNELNRRIEEKEEEYKQKFNTKCEELENQYSESLKKYQKKLNQDHNQKRVELENELINLTFNLRTSNIEQDLKELSGKELETILIHLEKVKLIVEKLVFKII